jgi:hypothetical protein
MVGLTHKPANFRIPWTHRFRDIVNRSCSSALPLNASASYEMTSVDLLQRHACVQKYPVHYNMRMPSTRRFENFQVQLRQRCRKKFNFNTDVLRPASGVSVNRHSASARVPLNFRTPSYWHSVHIFWLFVIVRPIDTIFAESVAPHVKKNPIP